MREGFGEEHPSCDSGQNVFILIFLVAWAADSFWFNFSNFIYNGGGTLKEITSSSNIKMHVFSNFSDAENFTNIISSHIADTYGNVSITGLNSSRTYVIRSEIIQIPIILQDALYNSHHLFQHLCRHLYR